MENDYFPQDKTEYYYFFQIRKIEEAKARYNECNGFFMKDDIKARLSFTIFGDELWNSMEIYKRLYDDFNTCADKIIKGEGIDSKESFDKHINMLMIIANETIDFTETLCFKKRKEIKKLEKFEYKDKEMRMDKILEFNFSILELINPDDLNNVITERYGNFVVNIVIFILLILTLYTIALLKNNFELSFNAIFYAVFALLFGGATLYITYLKISSKKLLQLKETKSGIYTRKYNLVNHSFSSSKWNKRLIKELKDIAEAIKNLTNR